jgi:hypothetical protein
MSERNQSDHSAFLLGSESEVLIFEGDGRYRYEPRGRRHAVDPASVSTSETVLAYAQCGMAVRVWRDAAFDESHPDAHRDCSSG